MSPRTRLRAFVAGAVLLALGFALLALPLASVPQAIASAEVASALCVRQDHVAADVPVVPGLTLLCLGAVLLMASALVPPPRAIARPVALRRRPRLVLAGTWDQRGVAAGISIR